ncbi:hypothetical protein M0813_24464 [Anaeramoeba flamelloides]|uniref:Uncharacterized protein n=1 Tax=Anaeramoeba flamelloides TaxID=1746091 RepID=A0ABQ8Y763_9EUKA|nr:hypothetical protein M0813_24464 [Anaeramoeba flamelloides]
MSYRLYTLGVFGKLHLRSQLHLKRGLNPHCGILEEHFFNNLSRADISKFFNSRDFLREIVVEFLIETSIALNIFCFIGINGFQPINKSLNKCK